MGKKKKEKKSGKSVKSVKKKKNPAAVPEQSAAGEPSSGGQPRMDEDEALLMFRALSDENRLLILRLLAGKELCTAELLEKVHVVQSTMSHHMKVLCDSGLVTCRRDGRKSCYSISQDGVKRLREYLNY